LALLAQLALSEQAFEELLEPLAVWLLAFLAQ
jgi:hypothetical protein